MGSRAVAAATHGSDAGSKSLDFVPVPSRKTVMGSRAVAAAIHGFIAPMPVLALQLNEFSRSWLVCARTHPPISTNNRLEFRFVCERGGTEKWFFIPAGTKLQIALHPPGG